MKRSPYKFARATPTPSDAHAALTQTYISAGHTPADAASLAARALGDGRLRMAGEKTGESTASCEQDVKNPSVPHLLTGADRCG